MLLGAHCSGGIKASLDRAEEIGADAVQLFAQSPRAWRFPEHERAHLELFASRLEQGPVRAALVHALYLINLATPNDEIYEKSATTLASTVDAAAGIEADGVVFHVGSHLGAGFEAGLRRVIPAMERALDRTTDQTWLLMENSAGAGATIGRSVDELAVIFDRLDGHPRLGVCLDSCHLYVSGIDVTDPAAYAAVLGSVDAAMGLDRLRALHVNDAEAPLGSNRDRHANVLDGQMGEQIGVFLAHPAVQDLPAVLETPGKDGHGPRAPDIEVLRDLYARWKPKKRASARGSARAARTHGSSAGRAGARRTRG
ncbi:MAG TPA: deoxyribonuclease IV [Gaiellaceae bacterium]|nr:deoxyribonuclease IV [Gaiellaceae bacterium]